MGRAAPASRSRPSQARQLAGPTSFQRSGVAAPTRHGAGAVGFSTDTTTLGGPPTTASLQYEITTAAVAPGLVAYVDGTPAGWTRVMPRKELPGVLANRALRRCLPDDAGAWWVTCFAVQQRYRGIGVAGALLTAAVAHAQEHGASAVEGHPVDTDALAAEQVSGSALFTGTMRLFIAAGFTEIARTYRSRPIMRREL